MDACLPARLLLAATARSTDQLAPLDGKRWIQMN